MSKEKTQKKRLILATSVDEKTMQAFDDAAWERRHRTHSEALREAINDWIAKDDNIGVSEINNKK